MPYYGPRSLDEKGDTIYYTLPDEAFDFGTISKDIEADTIGSGLTNLEYNRNMQVKNDTGAFVVVFVKAGDDSKLNGLLEYEKYKGEKLENIHIYVVKETTIMSDSSSNVDQMLRANPNFSLNNPNLDSDSFYSLNEYYFTGKPIYVMDYFAVLIDKDHHIRGYYDPTFISEVKKMIEEYKHLVLKDEHANMQENNSIEKR